MEPHRTDARPPAAAPPGETPARQEAAMAAHELKDAGDALRRGDPAFAVHELGDAAAYGATAAKDALTGAEDRPDPAKLQEAREKDARRAGGGTSAPSGVPR